MTYSEMTACLSRLLENTENLAIEWRESEDDMNASYYTGKADGLRQALEVLKTWGTERQPDMKELEDFWQSQSDDRFQTFSPD